MKYSQTTRIIIYDVEDPENTCDECIYSVRLTFFLPMSENKYDANESNRSEIFIKRADKSQLVKFNFRPQSNQLTMTWRAGTLTLV